MNITPIRRQDHADPQRDVANTGINTTAPMAWVTPATSIGAPAHTIAQPVAVAAADDRARDRADQDEPADEAGRRAAGQAGVPFEE